MDIMRIHQLQVKTKIGVYTWEQSIERTLLIDLDLGLDIIKAAKTDDVQHTINYVALVQSIEKFLAAHTFKLIESLAENLAVHILEKFPTPWLKLTVYKRYPLKHVQYTAITLERTRHDQGSCTHND